jgi:hypothetical protein
VAGGTQDRITAHGRKFLAEIEKLKRKPYVKAGIQAREFALPKQVEDGEKASGATVGDAGVYNEFGTDTIPARSFIRSTADAKANFQGEGGWRNLAGQLRPKIVAGQMTVEKALAVMGMKMEKDIREKIRSNVPPPNAPSTIRAKRGKTHTLINFGQLLNAIRSRVMASGQR